MESEYVVIRGVRFELATLVNPDLLQPQSIEQARIKYINALPFPYVVIENLFNAKLLELIAGEFDVFDKGSWRLIESDHERTHRLPPLSKVGAATQLYYSLINSGWFLNYLSTITGHKYLIPDPQFSDGGLHEVRKGGFFDIHIDFNLHHHTMLNNEVALITYLNKNWQHEYNGALELWDIEEKIQPVEVWPEFGHTVIFQQGVQSLHGHPKPLNTPEGISRRSIVSYYYKNNMAEKYRSRRHWTLFFQKSRFKHWFKTKYVINYQLIPLFGGQKVLKMWRQIKRYIS